MVAGFMGILSDFVWSFEFESKKDDGKAVSPVQISRRVSGGFMSAIDCHR